MRLFFHNAVDPSPKNPLPVTVAAEELQPGDVLVYQTKEDYNVGYYASAPLVENDTEISERQVHLYYNKLSDTAMPITRFSEIMLYCSEHDGEIWRRIKPGVSLSDRLKLPEEKEKLEEVLPIQVFSKSKKQIKNRKKKPARKTPLQNFDNGELNENLGVKPQPDSPPANAERLVSATSSLPEYGFLSGGNPTLYHLIPKGDILLKFEDGPWIDLSMRLPRMGLPEKCLIATSVRGHDGYYANHKFARNSRDAILTWHEGIREIPITDPPHCIYDSAENYWTPIVAEKEVQPQEVPESHVPKFHASKNLIDLRFRDGPSHTTGNVITSAGLNKGDRLVVFAQGWTDGYYLSVPLLQSVLDNAAGYNEGPVGSVGVNMFWHIGEPPAIRKEFSSEDEAWIEVEVDKTEPCEAQPCEAQPCEAQPCEAQPCEAQPCPEGVPGRMSQKRQDSIAVDFRMLTIFKCAALLVKTGILSLIYQPGTELFFITWHHCINQVHYNYEAWFSPTVLLDISDEGLTEYLDALACDLAKRINDSLPEKFYSTFKGCNVAGQGEVAGEAEGIEERCRGAFSTLAMKARRHAAAAEKARST